MKHIHPTILVLGFLCLMARNSAADPLKYDPRGPTRAEANSVLVKIQSVFPMHSSGISMMCVTACDEATGLPFDQMDENSARQTLFVNCVDVGTKTDKDLAFFQAQYPQQTKLNGVYIHSETIGVIHRQ